MSELNFKQITSIDGTFLVKVSEVKSLVDDLNKEKNHFMELHLKTLQELENIKMGYEGLERALNKIAIGEFDNGMGFNRLTMMAIAKKALKEE